MTYRLIYPEGDVTLADLAQAALAECGADRVSVVSGMGSQVVRVAEDCADAVMRRAGLAPEDPREGSHEDPHEGSHEGSHETPQTVSAPEDTEGPGADTPKTPAAPEADEDPESTDEDPDDTTTGRPAGRSADRPVKKTTARRTTSRRKEG